MSNNVTFYFDFSFSYPSIDKAGISNIEKAGITLLYRPILLDLVFQHQGHSIPNTDSLKMNYLTLDLERCTASLGIPYQTPPVFSFIAIEAMRFFYALDANDKEQAQQFATHVFRSAYADNKDMSQANNVASVLQTMGLDRLEIIDSGNFSDAKITLKNTTQQAISQGVWRTDICLQ